MKGKYKWSYYLFYDNLSNHYQKTSKQQQTPPKHYQPQTHNLLEGFYKITFSRKIKKIFQTEKRNKNQTKTKPNEMDEKKCPKHQVRTESSVNFWTVPLEDYLFKTIDLMKELFEKEFYRMVNMDSFYIMWINKFNTVN